jgi:hypothetical protein
VSGRVSPPVASARPGAVVASSGFERAACVAKRCRYGTAGSTTFVCLCPGWGDPRVNIQNDKGKAKAYQVRQVLKAIDKKEAM